MAEFKLEMKGICKSFPGVKALDNVQLSLRPGTVHALMGENGAGKSTLMKCLFGIYKMDAGEIYLDGQKVSINNPDEAMKYGIAMVHQELQPIPARSVAENLYEGRFPLKSFGPIKVVDHKKMYEDTAYWLKEVKMDFDRAEAFQRETTFIKVLRHASCRNGLQLLMHHGNTIFHGLIRITDRYFLSIEINFSGIHLIDTEQAFH